MKSLLGVLLLLAIATQPVAATPRFAQSDDADTSSMDVPPDTGVAPDTSTDTGPATDVGSTSDTGPATDTGSTPDSGSSSDSGPSTDTSVGAPPTDVPVVIVPTDTPVPTPVPTSTPTATPTSIAKDVPAATLSRQLPFANPGAFECDFLLDSPNDEPLCDAVTFPAAITIQFFPWTQGVPITLQVDKGKPQVVSTMTWDFVSAPGRIGPGTHTLTASENIQGQSLTASLKLTIRSATSPHLLVYPRTVPPGSTAEVWLAGFKPNTPLALGIYREQQTCAAFSQSNECYTLDHDLGTITTGGDGTANRSFQIGANEPRVAYMALTGGLAVDSQNPTDSLRKYGMPWFTVDTP